MIAAVQNMLEGEPLGTPFPTIEAQQVAKEAIRCFGALSYDRAEWERLVANSDFKPHGCLFDILGFRFAECLREQIMTDVVGGLRQRLPEFSRGPKRWREKQWTDEIIDTVLQVVIEQTEWSVSNPRERIIVTAPLFAQPDLAPQPTGFVPWRSFKYRDPVSNEPGVYLLAYFEDCPEAIVDPLDKHVIDIGKAVDQSTGTRLQQFERSAFGKTGHSAGWTFRLELLQKYYANDVSMLREFHNIYCSWRDVVDANPSDLETQLIYDYRSKWGSRPYLNRKD